MGVPRWVYAVPLVLCTCVCSNKLGGDLKLDGQPFVAKSCRSGKVYGFAGVEVTGASGHRLRVIHTPTGEAQVVVFAPGNAVGKDLGTCGTITVSEQNSTINDVKNVEGKASLSCQADGLALAGTLTFENCH